MGLLFHYIPRLKTAPLGVTHIYTIQTAKIWSLQMENTKSLWNKLMKTEKITKILEATIKKYDNNQAYAART